MDRSCTSYKSEKENKMNVNNIPGIDQLSIPEKILLVEDLWDSIVTDESSVPVPESHKNELDKRYDRYLASPGNLLSLKDLQERIDSRK